MGSILTICLANYFSKTEGAFYEKPIDHGWSHKRSIIDRHLEEYAGFQYIANLKNITFSLFSVFIMNFFVLKVYELI